MADPGASRGVNTLPGGAHGWPRSAHPIRGRRFGLRRKPRWRSTRAPSD